MNEENIRMLTESKECKECCRLLPLEDFHKHQGFKDGHRSRCKECIKPYTKKYYKENREHHLTVCERWQQENRERYIAYQKNYLKEKKEKRKETVLKYRSAFPERTAAKQRLNYLIFKGEVNKRDSCQICGCNDKRIEGHHHDYNKPLDVIWLCKACHGWVHKSREGRKMSYGEQNQASA